MKKRISFLLKMLAVSLGLILLYEAFFRGGREKRDLTGPAEYGESRYSFAMGSSVCVTLYGKEEQEYEAIFQEIKNLDSQIISWREADSELARLNRTYRTGEPYTVSDTLFVALSMAWSVCEQSEGALDITVRPLAELWNIEGADAEHFRLPTEEEIQAALSFVDYRLLTLNREDFSLSYAKAGMTVDLGACGKGYALDIARERLRQDGVDAATVSVGGSVLVYGRKPNGEGFRVGIRNPKGSMEDMLGYLEFPAGSDTCISTSGDYEKYVEYEGVRYHHIFDAKTGYPASGTLASVTVVCGNGLYSDALSTACYVLGEEKGRELLQKYDAQAIFIDRENHVSVTAGLEDNWFLEKTDSR